MTYPVRTFDLPELKGISQKQVDLHLKLYAGYVKHVNLIMEKIAKLRESGTPEDEFVMQELRRRFSFEFDGMRMHDYYFEQLEGGAQAHDEKAPLVDAATEKYGSWDALIAHVHEVAKTRGSGWVIVYFDPRGRTLHTAWVDEHHLGQLAGLAVLLAIDMWEHAYMVDYMPAEKNSYVEAFLDNVNWGVVERRFLDVAV